MTTATIPIEHAHRGDRIILADRAFTVASNHRIGLFTNRVGLQVGSELRIVDLHPGTEVTLTGYQEMK